MAHHDAGRPHTYNSKESEKEPCAPCLRDVTRTLVRNAPASNTGAAYMRGDRLGSLTCHNNYSSPPDAYSTT